MSNIISSDLTVFGIFQGEFGTNEKIRKSAFQDEFLGKNKNVRPLTTFKICCTEFTPSEKISLNFEIWTRVLKHPVLIEYEIIGEGSQISTNQKPGNSAFSLLIGGNLRPFPDNFVLY